ncbi:MAG TPA: Ppx/GppA family phosphatase, partial [Candidatus Krumholzibacteria bacterium]|nr:Ppx/GppA family phosphatase [Candidatus Krumholzibacteria bacterium]
MSGRHRRNTTPHIFGVIDAGTNSIKLTVATVSNGRVKTLHFARAGTRLGEGLAKTGRLQARA